jgi:hypothetical protein
MKIMRYVLRATDGSGYPGVQAEVPERGIAASRSFSSGVDGGARRQRTGAIKNFVVYDGILKSFSEPANTSMRQISWDPNTSAPQPECPQA